MSTDKVNSTNDQTSCDLMRAVFSEDRSTRWQAVEELGRRKEKRSISLLIDLLSQRDWSHDTDIVAQALANIGDIRAIKPLVYAPPTFSSSQRKEVVKAIAHFRDKAVEILIDAYTCSWGG